MLSRTFVLSLLMPGAEQILHGRPLRGVLLYFAFVLTLAVALLRAAYLGTEVWADGPFLIGLAMAVVLWLAAQGLLMRRGYLQRHRARFAAERNRHFELGVRCYLSNDLGAAAAAFREALRLDPEDADAWFYLEDVLAEAGRTADAQRARKRCAAVDFAGKWAALHRATL